LRAALATALGARAALVFADDAGAVAAVQAARDSGLVVLVIESAVVALDRAMLIAAIGPLAQQLAPATRLVALDLAEGARETDVVAAAEYLASAQSTTGQVLRITGAQG
jgi:hypothetical protein